MKAIVCEEPYKLSLAARRAPLPADGEVLIRIRRVGLCGTDYHIFSGEHPYLEYPRVMGHELSG
ncbi:MAG: alcohol dehydrogenase catalytic domain-containing protein, partial [Steroidobacteraceae bacterium]